MTTFYELARRPNPIPSDRQALAACLDAIKGDYCPSCGKPTMHNGQCLCGAQLARCHYCGSTEGIFWKRINPATGWDWVCPEHMYGVSRG